MSRNVLAKGMVLFAFLIFSSYLNYAQQTGVLLANYATSDTFVPTPDGYEPNGERDVVMSVTYTGFSSNAQTAFQYAVDIWASLLESSQPILIDANWTSLEEGVLGSAGANAYYADFFGAPMSNTYYPVALANKLSESDLEPGFPDIFAQFNSDVNWYFGTDGNPGAEQFDFVSVVLHELGHGLGFVGSADKSGSAGFIGFGGDPTIYDEFVETNTGMDIMAFVDGSTALGNALTGGNLFWFGTEAVAANGGTNPELYAPSTWNGGSSYSHWDEDYFSEGNANSLMTPFINFQEAIHSPGDVTLGMMADIGWTVTEAGGCAVTNMVFGQLDCADFGGGILPVFSMTWSIAGDCFIEDLYWQENGGGYVFANLPDAEIFVFDGDAVNLQNTIPDALYDVYAILSDGTTSPVYSFVNGNCEAGGLCSADNIVIVQNECTDNGSGLLPEITMTFEITGDCLVENLFWQEDGGGYLNGNLPDAGIFVGDGEGILFFDMTPDATYDFYFELDDGSFSPIITWENGNCSTGGCTYGTTIVYVDDCVDDIDVMFFDFNYTGDCAVVEMCAESNFDAQLICFDLTGFGLVSGDTYGIQGLDLGSWDFYYSLDDGSTSPAAALTITSCVETLGCTNEYAVNYNPSANTDDGSCIYDESICDCNGTEHTIGVLSWLGDSFGDIGDFAWDGQFVDFNCSDWGYDCGDIEGSPTDDPYNVCLGGFPPNNGCSDVGCAGTEITISITTDCWGEETGWTIVGDDTGLVAEVAAGIYGDQTIYNTTLCLVDDCYTFTMSDTFGDGMDGIPSGCDTNGDYLVIDQDGNVLADMGVANYGLSISHSFCTETSDILGCTIDNACNYNPAATVNDGSCDFTCYGCTDDMSCNYSPDFTIDDGSCDYSCFGCTNPSACNYDPDATIEDFSCDFSCAGCTNSNACNYNPEATEDNGSCDFSCLGCTDAGACNYDSTATIDNGSCDYSCLGCTNETACNFDSAATIEDGSCDFSCFGCTDTTACNFDPDATVENGSCDYSCYGCTDNGACNYNLEATIENGSCDYTCLGCTDPAATNYDVSATIDDGSCIYGPIFGCTDSVACNYEPFASDDDGSCEYDSCAGCTDPIACNYDSTATISLDVCDYESCAGCTDIIACNYDSTATLENDTCEYETCAGCLDSSACNYDPEATIDNESCEFESCAGCTDSAAINFDSSATIDDGSCVYDCEYPSIAYDTFCVEGEGDQFYVEMVITNLGNGAPYTISNNQNGDEIALTFNGTINLGPFDNDESVVVSVESNLLAGCFLTSPVLTDNCIVSVEEIELVKFDIYPNPNHGQFVLQSGNYGGNVNLACYDLSGKLIYNRTTTMNIGESISVYLPEEISNGMYLFEISTPELILQKRIIIQ